MAHNKRELTSTGGGGNTQFDFTPLEEEVIQLIKLRDSVDGVANAQKFGVPHKRTYNEANKSTPSVTQLPNFEDFDEPTEALAPDTSVDLELNPDERGNHRQIPQSKGQKSVKLIEKQIDVQQKFYESVKGFIKIQNERSADMVLNQKKIYRAIDRLADCQKRNNEIFQEQLAEQKRHNDKMERYALQKNQMKKQILEIEINKTEL